MALKDVPRVLAKALVTRYGIFLKRYPEQARMKPMQALARWQWLQPVVDEVQTELYPPAIADTVTEATTATSPQSVNSIYQRYLCQQGDPLSCTLCQPITPEGTRNPQCSLCGFPTFLPDQAELRGQLGGYQIEHRLGRRGNGRLYQALQQGTNQPVVIKEYLLPSLYFDAADQRQQKAAFENLAGFSLADGRTQDFRVIQPLDAIADEREGRCYLVLDGQGAYPSLSDYLQQGAFTQAEVRWLLNQVLQTLEFLHGQKFRLPSGLTQVGMVHGNLSLHSILLGNSLEPDPSLQLASLQAEPQGTESTQPEGSQRQPDLMESACFVYLSDLALWERLFSPPQPNRSPDSVAQDLMDLGYVVFYLLAGRMKTATGEPLNPRTYDHWPAIDPVLKEFILRLMQLDTSFASAEAARRELVRSPQKKTVPLPVEERLLDQDSKPRYPRWLFWGLGLFGVALLGWLIWWRWPRSQPPAPSAPPLANLKDVDGIPPGSFRYTSIRNGIWEYILQKPDLIQKGQTLEQRLRLAQPNLQLDYQPVDSIEAAIAEVQWGNAAFAVVPLIAPPPDDLEAVPIAYDALAVVVAFSYSNRRQGLPTQLQGKIALNQLQQLYERPIKSWQELGGANFPVSVYQPENIEVTAVFQQRVLQRRSATRPSIATLPEFTLFRTLIQDFEVRQVGGVGFSSLSKVVGQCSVYPLAIQAPGQNPVQAVVLDDGQPIQPSTNLCNKKGSYQPSVDLIRSGRYPLAYPIAIVYPRRNDRPPMGEKVVELFKTREGQTLLQKTGLVPLMDQRRSN